MSSSLITKVNKSRSPVTRKVLAKRAKKASTKKPQRPGKISAVPKSKKPALAKSRKASAPAKKTVKPKTKNLATKKASGAKKPLAKKVAPKKQVVKKAVARKAVKTASKGARTATVGPPRRGAQSKKPVRRSAAARNALKASRILPKPLPPPPKKPPSANALAAVRSFEQALKVFNRHEYADARSAFETILEKFHDQGEVTAGARTYLAVCDQRLSRLPSMPRDAEALYDQGVFQFNKGNTREALDLYDKALRADPRADHVWYSLAAAYARLTNSSKALDALRRAIAIRSVHRSHARRDLDFASLRGNLEFQQLTGFGFDLIEE
jgi:tetratricopeptide (TPR) repeat protein